MSENQFIMEVDLSIHPYQGIISAFLESWSSWNEPQQIHFISRDSTIAYDLVPGDLVLCKSGTIYQCDAGKVILPVKKLIPEELLIIIRKNPDISIKAWDRGGYDNFRATSIFRLIQTVYQIKNIILRISSRENELKDDLLNTISNADRIDLNNFVSSINNLISIKKQKLIFPEFKLKFLKLFLDEEINDATIETFIKINPSILESSSPEQLSKFLFPRIHLAAPHYQISPNFFDTKDSLGTISDHSENTNAQTRLEIIKELLYENFQTWYQKQLTNVSSLEKFDLYWLSEKKSTEIRKHILQNRKEEVERVVVLKKGVSRIQYEISGLRTTYLGSRLIDSLQISNQKKWIDESQMAIVEAALKRFNVKLKIKRAPKKT